MAPTYDYDEFWERRGRGRKRSRETHHRSPSPSRESRHEEDWMSDQEWTVVKEIHLGRARSLPDLRRGATDAAEVHGGKYHKSHRHHSHHRSHSKHRRRHGHVHRETQTTIFPIRNSFLQTEHHSSQHIALPAVGDTYAKWAKPVVFNPNDAVNHPREWLEKLEKLEAQIIQNAAKPDSFLHEPLPTSMKSATEAQHYMRYHLMPVLLGTSSNLSRLQRTHFCDKTISALVLERERHQVARLIDLPISVIQRFISRALRFIDEHEIREPSWSVIFLRYCVGVLAWFGLKPRVLQDFDPSQDFGSSSFYVKRLWSHETVVLALVHALRALAYTLDIAVVSFVGAHLEQFDEVYFAHPHEKFYRIPCDVHATSSIIIYRRHFECLAGFLSDTPAWVFEAHERGHIIDLRRHLYLRTSPDQLANIWGPVWRSEDLLPHGRTKYLMSRGFIVGWHHTSSDPPVLSGEYFCHWTNNPASVAASPGLPRYVNIPHLLIGAHPALEVNHACHMTQSDFNQHHWPRDPTHLNRWYLNSVSTPVILPSHSTSLIAKRRRGVTTRDLICSTLVAQPLHHLRLLGDRYGVEISDCTGCARRVPLIDILLSDTSRELASSLPWTREHHEWQHFRHAASSLDMSKIQGRTALEADQFFKFVVGVWRDLPHGDDRRGYQALYADERGIYWVRIPGYYGWTRLLEDALGTPMALAAVERTCLECRPEGVRCHSQHWHGHGHRHFYEHEHEYGNEHRHRPTNNALEPVYSTAIYLNPSAPLPLGLIPFRDTGVVTESMVRAVPPGEGLDLGPHGKLRVLGHMRVTEPHGYVLVVAWEGLREKRRWPVRVREFFERVNGKLFHAERIHSYEGIEGCVYVLVVSD